jgi:hypothetical protein
MVFGEVQGCRTQNDALASEGVRDVHSFLQPIEKGTTLVLKAVQGQGVRPEDPVPGGA